jgi:hypothetical protein
MGLRGKTGEGGGKETEGGAMGWAEKPGGAATVTWRGASRQLSGGRDSYRGPGAEAGLAELNPIQS